MDDTLLTLEVYYKRNPNNPLDLARVLYGPFESRADAVVFFDEGVKRGVFNSNLCTTRTINTPSYEPDFKES